MEPHYSYKAFVTNIVDGDTIDVVLELGFYVQTKMRLRLKDVDTAELNSSNIGLRNLAKDAKTFLMGALLNKEVLVYTYKTDKYGRWLADVFTDNQVPSINEQLIALGLARKYFGESRSILWADYD